MKLHNKLFILALSCISLHTQSKISQIFIANMYKKAVIININGKDAGTLESGTYAPLTNWPAAQPDKIKIKAKGSLTYHNGIQEEYLYLYKLNQNQNPTDEIGTINILDTNNILHFKYNTTTVPARPNSPNPAIQRKRVSIDVRNDSQEAFTLRITNKPEVVVQPGQSARVCSNCALVDNTDQPPMCSISFRGDRGGTDLRRFVAELAYSLHSNNRTEGVIVIRGITTNDITTGVIK